MITVFVAHPYIDHSRANKALLRAIDNVDSVRVRLLYDLYPEFSIDVEAEQRALESSDVVVWQHPIYWYSAPALLKLWFEKVLEDGWAYGPGGRALAGKRCFWVTTTGAGNESYNARGMHQHPFDTFEPVVRQTARFCGMDWEQPLIVHEAHRIGDDELEQYCELYRSRLISMRGSR